MENNHFEESICLKCKGTGRRPIAGIFAGFIRCVASVLTVASYYVGLESITGKLFIFTVLVYLFTIGAGKCKVCKGTGKVVLNKDLKRAI